MKYCSLCGGALYSSNLGEIFACSICSRVLSIKLVEFDTRSVPKPPAKKENPIKDLTSIPKPSKIFVPKPEEVEGEVENVRGK